MDPVHFSSSEILDMAVRIEENGEHFYRDAAAATNNAKLKELFEYLAEEEVGHVKYFKQLKDSVTDDSSPYGPFDPYIEEASLYIKSLADAEVFTSKEKGKDYGKIAGDEKAALEHSINMEKESILFYYELLKAIREKDKALMNEIIDEEKIHLRKLTEMSVELYGK